MPDAHDERLATYGRTLDRQNVAHVCECIERYPEIIAAALAAVAARDTDLVSALMVALRDADDSVDDRYRRHVAEVIAPTVRGSTAAVLAEVLLRIEAERSAAGADDAVITVAALGIAARIVREAIPSAAIDGAAS